MLCCQNFSWRFPLELAVESVVIFTLDGGSELDRGRMHSMCFVGVDCRRINKTLSFQAKSESSFLLQATGFGVATPSTRHRVREVGVASKARLGNTHFSHSVTSIAIIIYLKTLL